MVLFVSCILQYYYEPVTGAQFRSKSEVLYFLEMGAKRKKANTGTGTGSDATPSETPIRRRAPRKRKALNFTLILRIRQRA